MLSCSDHCHISKRSVLNKFKKTFILSGFLALCYFVLQSFPSDKGLLAKSKEETALFKFKVQTKQGKVARHSDSQSQNTSFAREDKDDEGTDDSSASFKLTAKFVTTHFAPVKKCNVVVVIQEKEFSQEPDQNGVIQLSGPMPDSSSDGENPFAQITISSGTPPNQIINTYSTQFNSTDNSPKLYTIDQQFFFKPINPLPTHILGRVVNQSRNPVSGLPLIVTYDYPVFQDQITVFTQEDGKFDAEADLDQLIPIFGNIVINKAGYRPFDLRRDTEYKDGFYLMNHLTFEFENDIVIYYGKIVIDISGTVKDQKKKPVPGIKLTVSCQSGSNSQLKQDFEVYPTDKDGNFHLQQESIFDAEEQILCEVIIHPLDPSQPQPPSIKITLKKENNYMILPIQIELLRDPQIGSIKGKIVSDLTGLPIQDPVIISFKNKGEVEIDIEQVKASSEGNFEMKVTACKGDTYSGDLSIESSQYKTKIIPIELNTGNLYTFDSGTIKLENIPQEVELNIIAQFVEKDNEANVPLANFPINLSLIKQSKQKASSSQLNSDSKEIENLTTDSDGKINYSLQVFNTDYYDMELTSQSEDFEDINIKKQFGPQTTFNGDLGVIQEQRKRIKAQIGGTVKEGQNPVSNAIVRVHTIPQLPTQPDQQCKTDSQGKFLCKIEVEKGKIYEANLEIVNEDGQRDDQKIGTLNKENEYKLDGLQIVAKFAVVDVKGIIKGQVLSTEDPKLICTYKVQSINPSVEYKQLTQVQNSDKNGQFEIDLDLHLGVKYQVEVHYKCSPQPEEIMKSYDLNHSNNYIIQNEIIQIGSKDMLFGILQGMVKSKNQLPVDHAKVKLSIQGKSQETFSDERGIFSINTAAQKNITELTAQLFVTHEKFQPFNSDFSLFAKNNFTLLNYQVVLKRELLSSPICGQLIDEKSNPIVYGAISLILLDSLNNPTTSFPINGVSDSQGKFCLAAQISLDDTYKGKLSINSPNFLSKTDGFELNEANGFSIKDKVIQLERKTTKLIYSGTLLNSLHKMVSCSEASLTFDDLSCDKGAQNISLEKFNGYFKFQEMVPMGYTYKAKVEFVSDNEETFNSQLTFSSDNNYQITNEEIIMSHKVIKANIKGIIQDKDTKQQLKNAQAVLRFEQIEFSNLRQYSYSSEKGEFSISQDIQVGYEYIIFVEADYPLYKSDSLKFTLSKDNDYTISNIILSPQKAGQQDLILGSISGHTYLEDGKPIPDSLVSNFNEDQPIYSYSVTSNKKGVFNITNIPFVKGNTYSSHVSFLSKDPDFIPENRIIFLSDSDNYMYTDLYLTASRIKTKYQINGQIKEKKTGKPLPGASITAVFLDQLNTENSYYTSDQTGNFMLQASSSKGVSLQGQLIISLSGYSTILPKFELPSNGQEVKIQYELEPNPSEITYPIDYKNLIPIKARVYEITKCSLFPHRYLPFVKVSLYLEDYSASGEDTLVGFSFTGEKGKFVIKSPRPYFVELQTYLLLELEDFDSLKVFRRIQPSDTFVETGGIQISRQSGVIDCSKKERKIQDKYDKHQK